MLLAATADSELVGRWFKMLFRGRAVIDDNGRAKEGVARMKLGVPREIRPGERRAAATPESTARLIKLGFEVLIERGAGAGAAFSDEDYQAAGARLIADPLELWREAELVLKVLPPEENPALGVHEADLLR